MSIARSVADVLRDHVTFELESLDRMYLNVYVPKLQHEQGVVAFFRYHRGQPFASSVLMKPISDAFVAAIEAFVAARDVPLVSFAKGERKDDRALAELARFAAEEGVLFVGKAQEKSMVFRTQRRTNAHTGRPYSWIVRATAMVNHYYFYCVDAECGPFFLKVGSYFPYTAKLCLNGHEYLKRQLAKAGIAFTALDNGLLACAEPERAQVIADGLGAEQIEGLLRKWLAILPQPFPAADREAGYRYEVSILQAEFALTQILDRPQNGRVFFEEVIRENLDLGRPDQVQLLFARRVSRRTPGRFRTRVITDGVTPALYVDYKSSRIKQYHKEGRGLRTETTINNTRDFAIGKRLTNLPALREVGFSANRRLLDVQRISHDCMIGEAALERITRPRVLDGQRVSALPFTDPRVQALFGALVAFRLLPRGFSNRDLRERLAPLLGREPSAMTPGQLTYDLRRLRFHGLIRRIPHTNRYRPTEEGLRTALFYTRVYARLFRPGLSHSLALTPPGTARHPNPFVKLESAMEACCRAAQLAA